MRGSNYSDLAGEIFFFGKVVAYERWLQGEVRLYVNYCVLVPVNSS